MPPPPLPRKIGLLMKKEIEQALRDGFTPPGVHAGLGGTMSAMTIAAQRLGIARATMQGRVAIMERMGIVPDWSLYQAPDVAPSGVNMADEVKSLKRRLREMEEAETIDKAILAVIGNMASTPVEPPKWTLATDGKGKGRHIVLTIWSDWHAGEVVNPRELHGLNEYNSQIMERRVRDLVETTIHLCRNHGPGNYQGAVICLLGDFISGGLHPELLRSDELTQMQAALHVRDTLAWALERMADEFKSLYIPCTSGNHGRNTHKPEFKGTVYTNFDWLIYEMLIRHFAKDKRIVFDNPPTNEVHFRIFGQRYLATHGDMLGVRGGDGIIGSVGPIMRGSLKVGKQAAAFGRDFDYLLMGHWHQPLYLPGIIVANSLKGWDEYAAKSLRAPPSIPSQPLVFVNHRFGHVSYSEIFLEKPKGPQQSQWGKA